MRGTLSLPFEETICHMLFPGDSLGDDRRYKGLWSRNLHPFWQVLENFLASFTQPQQKWGLRRFGPYKSKLLAILRGFLYDNWGKPPIKHCHTCAVAVAERASSKARRREWSSMSFSSSSWWFMLSYECFLKRSLYDHYYKEGWTHIILILGCDVEPLKKDSSRSKRKLKTYEKHHTIQRELTYRTLNMFETTYDKCQHMSTQHFRARAFQFLEFHHILSSWSWTPWKRWLHQMSPIEQIHSTTRVELQGQIFPLYLDPSSSLLLEDRWT